MSKSAKSNLGHKRRMTHSQKMRLMRGMKARGEFSTFPYNILNWRRRKFAIRQRVVRRQTRAHYHAEVRKGERRKAAGGTVVA